MNNLLSNRIEIKYSKYFLFSSSYFVSFVYYIYTYKTYPTSSAKWKYVLKQQPIQFDSIAISFSLLFHSFCFSKFAFLWLFIFASFMFCIERLLIQRSFRLFSLIAFSHTSTTLSFVLPFASKYYTYMGNGKGNDIVERLLT